MTIQFSTPSPISATEVSTTPVHNADILTGDNGLAHIQLKDQLYTLRITRAGKLILTK
ncbi:MAG: hemin uptake protein HemP [Shimia sp.]|jgi:hemin uptake protein HemP|uniref:hemin uptake protein HemP n=1 Tax=Shimia sp. TaxID=1954381 RepID=UPI004059F71C